MTVSKIFKNTLLLQQPRVPGKSAAQAESDAAVLAKDIAALDADVAKFTSQQKEATSVREKEHEDFQVEHKDYSESLDALDRAIVVLKKQSADVPQVPF